MSLLVCPTCGERTSDFNLRCTACGATLPLESDDSIIGRGDTGGADNDAWAPKPAAISWAPAAVVAERYVLDRLLGEGGMGIVWAATQTATRRPVALKFLKSATPSSEAHRRFLREAKAAFAVRHTNVIQVHEILEMTDGSPVMVMELLVGESLSHRLRREPVMPLPEAARVLGAVVSAVGAAHALGIIHRDIKPENIFLAENPEEPSAPAVKVLDFGIAKLTANEGDAARSASLTATGAMLGTPCYMSPEQGFGEKDIDHRTDIWSLGMVLFQCASGVLPTRADNLGQVFKILLMHSIPPLEQVAPDLPSDLTTLVNRMLSRKREDRPADLGEVEQVLARYTSTVAPSFGRPKTPPKAAPEPSPEGEPRHVIRTVDVSSMTLSR